MLDILHVSDSHYLPWKYLDAGADTRWKALCRFIEDQRERGSFQPELIAFTGDLIHSAWPQARRSLRRAVLALSELAQSCGFLDTPGASWSDALEGPAAQWTDLLGKRLLIVPGNHDVFPLGLRCLYSKFTDKVRKVAIPAGCSLVPITADARHLSCAVEAPGFAALLLDTTGSRAAWRYAKGEFAKEGHLAWPNRAYANKAIRVCLLHGHPVQVPFKLEGLDGEAYMVLENAGLLLRSLADLSVDLVLHGHRHYPAASSLSIHDSDGNPKQLAIIGAGSATRAPKKWRSCAVNLVRVHQDRSIEVSLASLAEGSATYSLGGRAPREVRPPDFTHGELDFRMAVLNGWGDTELCVRFLRTRAERSAVSIGSIPLVLDLPGVDGEVPLVSAWQIGSGAPAHSVEWRKEEGRVYFEPPLGRFSRPISVAARLFRYNAIPRNRWEAAALGLDEMKRETALRVPLSTEVGLLTGRVHMRFVEGEEPNKERFFVRVKDPLGDELESESAASTYGLTVRYRGGGEVSAEFQARPSRLRAYWIGWSTPDSHRLADVERDLGIVRAWQARIRRERRRGRYPLDDWVAKVGHILTDHGIAGAVLSLFVPDEVNESAPLESGEPVMLRFCGGAHHPSETHEAWDLRYGEGVAGRAWRDASCIWYDVHEARATRESYLAVHDDVPAPQDYYARLREDPGYSCLLAVPILPTESFTDLKLKPSFQAPYAMLIASVGVIGAYSPMLQWGDAAIGAFAVRLMGELERMVWGESGSSFPAE